MLAKKKGSNSPFGELVFRSTKFKTANSPPRALRLSAVRIECFTIEEKLLRKTFKCCFLEQSLFRKC